MELAILLLVLLCILYIKKRQRRGSNVPINKKLL